MVDFFEFHFSIFYGIKWRWYISFILKIASPFQKRSKNVNILLRTVITTFMITFLATSKDGAKSPIITRIYARFRLQ